MKLFKYIIKIYIMDIITKYKLYIYERYNNLLKLGKTNEMLNNYDLAKIFEYYSCIKLTEEFKQYFYEYSDIEPNYKKGRLLIEDQIISGIKLTQTLEEYGI